jgi:hypothetical protein
MWLSVSVMHGIHAQFNCFENNRLLLNNLNCQLWLCLQAPAAGYAVFQALCKAAQ